jgi:hypothetical protein
MALVASAAVLVVSDVLVASAVVLVDDCPSSCSSGFSHLVSSVSGL